MESPDKAAALDSLQVTDAQSAAVAVAPRVKLEDIEAAIAKTYFFNGHQAALIAAPKGE